MISVAVLDVSAKRYEKKITHAAHELVILLSITRKHVDILLVGDKQMQKNVLAFPADPGFPRPDLTEPSLGEIHLNPTYIQAHNEDLLLMLTHGFLHLLGYDHENSRDRIVMEKKERELLAKLANF